MNELEIFISHQVEYLKAVSPVLLLHFIFPPLYFFRGELPPPQFRWLCDVYRIWPAILLNEDVIMSLTLHSDKGFEIYQYLTHLFIHANYEHLFSNAMAALNFGYPVFNEFQHQGLYSLFLLGGIIASLPSPLRSEQRTAFAKLWRGLFLKEEDGLLHPLVDKFSTTLGTITANVLRTIVNKSCGSSGAVCALMGCELVLASRDISIGVFRLGYYLAEYPSWQISATRIIKGIAAKEMRNKQPLAGSNKSKMPKEPNRFLSRVQYAVDKSGLSPSKLLRHCYTILHSWQYISIEFKEVFASFSNVMSFTERSLKALDLATVNHVAHLQGALFGILYGIAFGCLGPALRRAKESR